MTQDVGRALREPALVNHAPSDHGPSGFDPARGARCECSQTGKIDPAWTGWYDAERELPFVNHAPGKCECTNELARYRSSDGVVRWLCSCCHVFGDTRLSDSDGSGEAGETALAGSTVGDSAGREAASPEPKSVQP